MKQWLFVLVTFVGFGWHCRSYQATSYDFPKPVDTQTRPIELQEKGVFEVGGVYADNTFAAARLNGFEARAADGYRVMISPENEPINPSPYYAFRLWSAQPKPIRLELHYEGAEHRYWPKLSRDGRHWTRIDSSAIYQEQDSIHAWLSLEVGPDTLWVAAQEVQSSQHVAAWCRSLAAASAVHFTEAGTSKLGRSIPCLDIYTDEPEGKDAIVILSRQHPPEVTGYLALQAFLEEVLANNKLSRGFLQKYRLLVYPLMNPDGVDLGHWRHNAGGIDLNRDWAYYRQPETRAVADHVVRATRTANNRVILGLDFHSTYYDVYYTFDQSLPSVIQGFKDYWLLGIEGAFEAYVPKDAPAPLGQPVSKTWFFTQFQAEGITYEIGDDTPRDFIRQKGRTSAREMMKLLVMR